MKSIRFIALIAFMGSTQLVHASQCPNINYGNHINPAVMVGQHSVILNGVTWDFMFNPSFHLTAMIARLEKATPMEEQGELDATCKYQVIYMDQETGTHKNDVEFILKRPLSSQEKIKVSMSKNMARQSKNINPDIDIHTTENGK